MATIRQKKLAKEIVENRGQSTSVSMKKVGYSKAYSKNPQQLTATKSWQELMNQYLPDDLLARKHEALLLKTDKKGIDTMAVKSGLDMAYKLKNRYMAPEQTVVVKNYEDMTDEELQEQINARLNKTGQNRSS
jgi:hypothetical protein